VLRKRLDRTCYDHSDVAGQAVGRLRVGEGSYFGRDGCDDEVGEPLVERAGEQRFVQSRLE